MYTKSIAREAKPTFFNSIFSVFI